MKEMQVYSKILLQTCFVDIIAISLFVFAQPAILPILSYISSLFGNLNFLFDLPGLYSSSIAIFINSGLASLVAVLNPIVTILSVRNYRQIIFRCKNNSNNHQVSPMPETSMPDRTIHI
uniref:G_PROTEIN_RECEP_F1_2 domain-containing protein n=1 Tax=Meloidogyne hapla TaxID=6305 RepID=A0A1I8BXC1_MELHA